MSADAGPVAVAELADAAELADSEDAAGELEDAGKLEDAAGTVAEVIAAAGLAHLGKDPPIDSVLKALQALAKLLPGRDPLFRAAAREAAAQALRGAGIGSPSALVDAALGKPANEAGGSGLQGAAAGLADPDPWPQPVAGAPLLAELVKTFKRFLALPDGAPTALALWTLHSHAHDAAAVSPLLALTSPEKRCGKTTTLMLLGALVPRDLLASSVSTATVFRAVEKYSPTLLVDEADTFLTGRNPNDELRGILNSGHNRAAARVIRCVGDEHEPRVFKTWAPKAVALIGKLPPTLEDRSVLVQLRRRAPGDELQPLRIDRLSELEPLRRKAARWATDNLEALRKADPAVPGGLHDRAADNWRPLLAIADAAGGVWPEEARKAAALLGGAADDGDAAGPMLLADLRELFDKKKAKLLSSAEIIAALVEREDRPWPEWRRGQPMTPTALGRVLKPYGVTSRRWREEGKEGPRHRGYVRADLEDAFARYTPLSSRASRDTPTAATVSGTFASRASVGDGPASESAETPTPTLIVPAGPAQSPPTTGEEAVWAL